MDETLDLTLFLGGTRSGKSARAEALARELGGPVLYVATAALQPGDAAMAERIRRHRARRPPNWSTLECPLRLAENIAARLPGLRASSASSAQTQRKPPAILVDCVTLWVSNILFSLPDPGSLLAFENAAREEVFALLELMAASACRWILVSSEIGLGGIDSELIPRNYCDGLGMVNQLLAARAKDAFLVVAGRMLQLEQTLSW